MTRINVSSSITGPNTFSWKNLVVAAYNAAINYNNTIQPHSEKRNYVKEVPFFVEVHEAKQERIGIRRPLTVKMPRKIGVIAVTYQGAINLQ